MYNVIIDPDCLKTNVAAVNEEVINQFIDLLSDIKEMENYDFLIPLVPAEAYELDNSETLNIFNLASYISGDKYTSKDFNTLLNYLTKVEPIDYSDEEKGYYFHSLSMKSIDDNGEEVLSISEKLAMNLILSNLFRGNTLLRSKLNRIFECSSEIKHLEENEVYHFDDVLKLFATTNQILNEIKFVDLWKHAKTSKEYEGVINVYFLINKKSEDMKEWEIGQSLFDHLKKYGFHTEPTKINALLKAMLHIVWIDETNRKTHKLRTSKSGGAPQVVGPKGKAMRMDIDQEYHLHYWENQNKIVFASINTHNDFSIPI